ncbi:MAG TPA: hypothetical protein VH105_18920 [Burkholderiales bacterium]|jgi:hypothetical protein|nr:hypothetical protein [Burkholderiales bacterium]
MQALLIGGPCHGQVVALDDTLATRSSFKAKDGAAEYEYVRRSERSGHTVVLYAVGDPSYTQVVDAIRKSDLLSSTGKMRVLGPDYTLPANDREPG